MFASRVARPRRPVAPQNHVMGDNVLDVVHKSTAGLLVWVLYCGSDGRKYSLFIANDKILYFFIINSSLPIKKNIFFCIFLLRTCS